MSQLKITLYNNTHTPQILSIYAQIVEHTHTSFEYVVPELQEMQNRINNIMEKHPWLVILDGEIVAGYAYGSTLRGRKAYEWSAELSVYMHPDYRGRGLASILYSALIDILKLQNVQRAFGVIALPNDASVTMHEKMGFRKVGELPDVGYKHQKWITTAYFVKDIQSEMHPNEFIPFSKISNIDVQKVCDHYKL